MALDGQLKQNDSSDYLFESIVNSPKYLVSAQNQPIYDKLVDHSRNYEKLIPKRSQKKIQIMKVKKCFKATNNFKQTYPDFL